MALNLQKSHHYQKGQPISIRAEHFPPHDVLQNAPRSCFQLIAAFRLQSPPPLCVQPFHRLERRLGRRRSRRVNFSAERERSSDASNKQPPVSCAYVTALSDRKLHSGLSFGLVNGLVSQIYPVRCQPNRFSKNRNCDPQIMRRNRFICT